MVLAAFSAVTGCRSRPPDRVVVPAPGPPVLPAPEPAPAPATGDALANAALTHLGAPYRYGGSTPAGFDCSGLVFHLHGGAGIEVPRTAAEQFRAARPIDAIELEPGDLVFFRTQGRRVDHVGIYVGEGRFVHAPRRRRPVSLERLDGPYYWPRFAGAGRFWR